VVGWQSDFLFNYFTVSFVTATLTRFPLQELLLRHSWVQKALFTPSIFFFFTKAGQWFVFQTCADLPPPIKDIIVPKVIALRLTVADAFPLLAVVCKLYISLIVHFLAWN